MGEIKRFNKYEWASAVLKELRRKNRAKKYNIILLSWVVARSYHNQIFYCDERIKKDMSISKKKLWKFYNFLSNNNFIGEIESCGACGDETYFFVELSMPRAKDIE